MNPTEIGQTIGQAIAASVDRWQRDSLARLAELLALSRLALYLRPTGEDSTELRRVFAIPGADDPEVAAALALEQPSVAALADTDQPLFTAEPARALLPLNARDEWLGVLDLHRAERPFTPTEASLLQTLAAQLAVALQNGRLRLELDERTAQFNSISRISQTVSLAASLRSLFQGVQREIFNLVDATGLSISLLDDTGQRLHWIYGYEFDAEVDLSNIPPLPITSGFSGFVARNRTLLHIYGEENELRNRLRHTVVGAPPSTWLGLPLIVGSSLLGVLAVENAQHADGFTNRDVELLTTVAGPIAIAINNQRQYDQLEAALIAQSQDRLYLQTAAEVAAAAGSILDRDELIQTSVQLLRERFELYYVGLYLLNDEGTAAILHGGTGQAGARMVAEQYGVEVGDPSLVGGAVADGEPRIVQDVAEYASWRPNPLLPHTQAAMVLPLRVRGKIIGALSVESSITGYFTPGLIRTLHTMSDQLAIAVENAQLLARTEARAQRQRFLNMVSTQLHRTADVEAIISLGLSALSEQLGGTAVALHMGRAARTNDAKQATIDRPPAGDDEAGETEAAA